MNSKSKGNSFERLISKKISLWFSNGERDDLFWRTQSSGGRHTSRSKKNLITENQEGDICSTSELSSVFSKLVSIECKHYKSIDMWDLILGKGKVIDWYVKLRSEMINSQSSFPIVIFRQNYKPIMMLAGNAFHTYLQVDAGCYIKCDEPNYLSLFEFEKFLKNISPEYFMAKLT